VISEHFKIVVLLPVEPVVNGDNADSLVLSLDYDVEPDGTTDISVLLCGDAEAYVLSQLTQLYPTRQFDYIKVGHHGSKDSISEELLSDWSCQVALISCGENNRYGHPHMETLQALYAANVHVLRTDQSGDIHLRFSSSGVTISYAYTNMFWSH